MRHSIFSTRLLIDFWREAIQMFRDDGTRILESVFAGILTLWGAYLLLPLAMRQDDIYQATYRQVGPESVWAGAMLFVGVMMFVAAVRDHYYARRGALLFSVCLWAAIWWVYHATGRTSVGLVIIPFYALCSALLFWRLRIYRPSEGKHGDESGRDRGVGGRCSDHHRFSDEGHRHLAGTAK